MINIGTDLKALGGLEPVFSHLTFMGQQGQQEPEVEEPAGVRAAAAHVIGTAASNNVKFQQQLLDTYPDVFPVLISVSYLK